MLKTSKISKISQSNQRPKSQTPKLPPEKNRGWPTTLLTMLGLASLVTSCGPAKLLANNAANAQSLPSPTPTHTPWSTASPTTVPPTQSPTMLPDLSHTSWSTATPWATPTPWSTPVAWNPTPISLPALNPLPEVPTTVAPVTGNIPVGYAPPDGVDIFGGTILRWTYYSDLAEDEWFDIKIKPPGSENSVFVDWTKNREYQLQPWQGWSPGLYTWQIGIVKGYKEGDTKHFIADTGRDSAKFVIKWQSPGNSGYGNGSTGQNTGGGKSGGS